MADTEQSNDGSPKRVTRRQAAKIAEKAAIEDLAEKNVGKTELEERKLSEQTTDKFHVNEEPMDTDNIGNGTYESTENEKTSDTQATENNTNDNVNTENATVDDLIKDKTPNDAEAMDTTVDESGTNSKPEENNVSTNIATDNVVEDKIEASESEEMESESIAERNENGDDQENSGNLNNKSDAQQEQSNDKSQIENGDIIANKNIVPELEGEQLTESSPTSKPTLNLTPKTKIKLNIIPKETDDIVEVPVIKPKIDVIDVPDDEVGDTEVVSEDELPPPPSKEKVDGAEEVSDEELPAGPKLETPPEGAEEVSDDELPAAPKPDTPPEGAEEVSDEELPAAPKPELPPEAEDVSDEELQEVKSKSDAPVTKDAKAEPPPTDTVTVILDDDDDESKCIDKKRARDGSDDCSFPTKEDAKKLRSSSPEKKPKKLPELQQYWKAVKENPSDFTGWTYLLKFVDQESDVEAAEEAYSTFLAQYPYCYGYWRKYADYERKRGTQTKCEEVFDQGLKAIPLSVDLWIHFLNYVKAVHVADPDFIRQQYKRCVDICGLEFRADALWDSYIKWEVSQKNMLGAMELFDRVLEIPLHGNTSHFDNFQTFVASNSPKDILPVETFLALRKEILSLNKDKNKEDDGDDKPPGDEDYAPPGEEPESAVIDPEEANALRESIVLQRRKKHKETAAAVAERRPFEEGIKRPYFHVKALEKCQLKNWKDYLDFEIKMGDEKRIEVLFERCLIACALYEEFWHKYICYLQGKPNPDIQKIGDLFQRACSVHHSKKVNMHFEWAAFVETNGNAEKAQEILENIEKEHPQLIEIAMRRIALEKRRKLTDNVCKLYEKYIEQWSSDNDKQNYFDLVVKYARYSTIVLKNVDKAVEILKNAIEIEKDSRSLQNYTRLYLQLIDKELHRPEIDISRIVSYLNTMLERSSLTLDQKLLIVTRKLELLEEYGDDIVVINQTVEEFRSLVKQQKQALESRKPASLPVPVVEIREKKEIPTQIISAVRKSKPGVEPPPPNISAHPPPPQNVFYPGPPSQTPQFIPQGQYPPPQQPSQYTPAGVPPPPPNFNSPYGMDPNGPIMYSPSPYPMYGGPPNFSGGNWPPGPGNYGPGTFQTINPPPNTRRY